MRVKTPAMKLDVRIDDAVVRDGELVFEGVAGILPCQTSMSVIEVRRLLRMALRPRVIRWLLSRQRPAP